MSKRKLLLHVSAGLELEGGGTAVVGRLVARTTAEFARSAGLDFRVLHLGRGLPAEHLRGIDVTGLSGRPRMLAASVLWAQAARRCAGIVYDHPGPARIQALVPSFLAAPYLVIVYGIDIWRPLGPTRARSLRAADELISISHYSIARALRESPWMERAEVIHPALEERPPDGERNDRLLATLGSGYFLTVGRLAADERYKGHRQLIAAMPELLRRHPEARLVIAGSGDDREPLERLSTELRMERHVTFTGFVSEATLRVLYERCAAFVMPSLDEGFGLVFLEAMRAGKPCIAAAGSAAEEIIEPGVTGLLVDRDREEEIVAALDRLLGQPADAAAMGQRGHQRWLREFSTNRFKQAFRQRLERLTNKSHVRD